MNKSASSMPSLLTFDHFCIDSPIDPLSATSILGSERNLNQKQLIKDLCLSVYENETLAIVGESGSGKSLTAHSILQLLPKSLRANQSGEIYYNGKNLLALSETEIRQLRQKEIAIIFQEPMVALNPVQSIGKQLAEVLLHQQTNHKLDNKKQVKKQIRESIITILDKVGLKSPALRLNHFAHQFSGGERQRIIIAMALLRKPKILIADEATTALDVTTQQQIIELLLSLKIELGMTLIFISHNLNLVRKIADRVAVMYQGRCVEVDTTEQIFTAATSDYTKSLIQAHQMPKISRRQMIIDEASQHSHLSSVLRVKNLAVSIKRKISLFKTQFHPILHSFSVDLNKGLTIGIVGESGSGKSTTAFAITKLIQSTGSIQINGIECEQLTEKQFRPLRKDVQIIFQDPFSTLNPKRTIKETIEEGIEVHEKKLGNVEREDLVCSIMQEVGLDPNMRNRYPHQFSGGQRQRIAIARALIIKPKLLILDEPTSALDKKVEIQILALLSELQEKYQLAYLFISHDLSTIKLMCDSVIVLKEGKIIEAGITDQIFNTPKEDYTKLLVSASKLV